MKPYCLSFWLCKSFEYRILIHTKCWSQGIEGDKPVGGTYSWIDSSLVCGMPVRVNAETSSILNKSLSSHPEVNIILLWHMLFYQLHSRNLDWANLLFTSRAPASNPWLVNKNCNAEALLLWDSIRCPEMP